MTLYLDERNRRILEFIDGKPREKILVIGTGVYPKIEQFLHENGCRGIVSGDIEERNLESARRTLPNVRFVKLDAQNVFPFRNSEFDKVVFTEVLEHLKDQGIALNEIRRVLKKDGMLVLSVPKWRLWKIFHPVTIFQHEREYSERGIRAVLEKNGFRIKRKFVGGNIFELFNIWLHLVYKYLFRSLHVDPFFRKQIDRSYKKDFRGSGTDIIILARPLH